MVTVTEPSAPLEAWLEWFGALAPELSRELAQALLSLWPERQLQSRLHADEPAGALVGRLRTLAGTPLEAVGTATLISSLTDLVLAERADPHSWASTDALLDALEEAQSMAGLEGSAFGEDLSAFAENARARSPLRQRQWSAVAKSWVEVRDGPLALETLDQARRAARLRPPS